MASNTTTFVLPPIYFYQYVFQFTSSAFAFCSQSSLLWTILNGGLNRQLSANLLINIIYWVIATFTVMIHSMVMGRFGHSDALYISGPWATYSAAVQAAATTGVVISVFFVMAERWYSLSFPSFYAQQLRAFMWPSLITTTGATLIILLLFCITEQPVAEKTNCLGTSCVLSKSRLVYSSRPKLIFTFCNVFMATVFFRKLSVHQARQTHQTHNFKRANSVAIGAIFCEMFLGFVPTISFAILSALNVPYAAVLGPFQPTCWTINAIVTAIIYRLVLTRRAKNTSMITNSSSIIQRRSNVFK